MGWLWNGRGNGRGRNKSNSRPRVAQAIGAAHESHLGSTPHLGGATAAIERAIWSHDLPSYSTAPAAAREKRADGGVGGTLGMASVRGAAPTRRQDFSHMGALLERAENTARRLGRSRAEMWEEALGAWLETQITRADVAFELGSELGEGFGDAEFPVADARPAPRPWLFEARRQRVWGEIDETLGSLRSA
jgi:hypothetical protein